MKNIVEKIVMPDVSGRRAISIDNGAINCSINIKKRLEIPDARSVGQLEMARLET